MRKLIRSLVRILVQNRFTWLAIRPFIRIAEYVRCQRDTVTSNRSAADQCIMDALGAPVVKNGPFQGLIYPAFLYSSNFPKIIGSYESEISDIIETLCQKKFTEVVNIGCAEGYYAVGFARRIDDAIIAAYDSRSRARRHCQEMARLNRVDKKLRIRGSFTKESMLEMNLNGQILILCDCEGGEKEIFTQENLSRLRNCELLIEIHDFVDISISDYLRGLFSNTHDILTRHSTDDVFKARTYHFPETDRLDLHLRKLVFEERRPAIMEWFYLTPKSGR